MYMRSKLLVLFLLAGTAYPQSRLDSHSKMHLTFPEESPVSVVGADWGESTQSPRGSAMLLDLHTSLLLKNAGSKRIRGITLLVLAQEVTPGGKASVTVPSLNVAPGETFPIRVDLRLLRPMQNNNGPAVEIGLDGVLYEDLSFYGTDRLNSRRAMTVWELEARRDRKYFRNVLENGGPDALKQEMLASLERQAGRSGMDAHVAQGRASNTYPEHNQRVAFLELPNAPVDITGAQVGLAGDEARRPTIYVSSRSDRPIRSMEVGWMVKDQRGKTYITGVIPLNVSLQPFGSTTIVQDSAFKFSEGNGQPVLLDSISGFVSSVEYSDGRMWVPDRNPRLLNPSPEEQRLTQIYRKKGAQALAEELKKF
jgi:hypothetical protein